MTNRLQRDPFTNKERAAYYQAMRRGRNDLAEELYNACADRAQGLVCPECAARGPHDDNGEFGAELTYCCRACGGHWDAFPLG